MDLAKVLGTGILLGLVPGLHPMLIKVDDPFYLGILYGAFTGSAISVARKGLQRAETASEQSYTLEEILKGLLLTLALLPITLVLYGVSIPDSLLVIILLLGSISLMVRDPLVFLLSGILGLFALRGANGIVSPLASGLLYLFGLSHLLGRQETRSGADWKKGVVASLFTGYFPALPSSAWSRAIGRGSVAVAAAATPLFSLVALAHGKTRAAMTAFIPQPDPWILTLVGISYTLSLILVIALSEVLNLEKLAIPEEVGLGIVLGHAIFHGLANVLLFTASVGLVLSKKNTDPAAYFGFLVLPTLIYYA